MLGLTADGVLLFVTRSVRMFAYGFLSFVLVLYLTAEGLNEKQIGFLLTMALVGDTVISLWITTAADRIGRKRMLMLGAALMTLAGLAFAVTSNYAFLIVAATIGVLSPSDKEVGPFLSIEQAALAQTVSDQRRTAVFAWYHLAGSLAAAFGALVGGLVSESLIKMGRTGPPVYRPLVFAYALIGVVLLVMFARLSAAAEATKSSERPPKSRLGLHQSRRVIFRLSALFALDAFGGGFILQSILVYWLHVRFGLDPKALGVIFFAANLLAAFSALSAAGLARRFGLVNTMVFTHLPSNVLLILVPFAPSAPWAVGLLLARFAISQMDVPTRQSYTLSVVRPDERSAAAGITTVARSLGAAISPTLAGLLLASPRLMDLPLLIAGGVKIVYDLWLYLAFSKQQAIEESEGG